MSETTTPYASDPIHKYPLLTPKFWHGLRMGDWASLAKQNWRTIAPRHWGTATTITGFSVFNSTFATLQQALLGRRIERAKPQIAPLFVLGHWRSGTTMLHEMLMRDPAHACPNTYQCFAPHHFLVTDFWVRPLTGWLLPKKRPMDNVGAGWGCPQEDEFALCSLGVPTPYLCWAFPDGGPVHREYLTLEGAPVERVRRWKRELERFVGAMTLRDPRRLVLKSPPHTARVRTLLECFPSAKFIHIVRDPMVLFPSTVRLWKSLCDVQGLQRAKERYDWIEGYVLDNLVEMYNAFERDRELIAPGRLAELRYEELVADPVGQLRRVYQELELGGFDRVEEQLGDYLGDKRDYKTNRYALPPDIEATVRQRWADYFQRYGYSAAQGPTAPRA